MKGLNAKQEIFVRSLARGASPAEAYRDAYDPASPTVLPYAASGRRLMRHPALASYVDAARIEAMLPGHTASARAELFADVGLSRGRILGAIARVAFADLRQLASWDADGKVVFRASDEFGTGEAGAIAEIVPAAGRGGKAVRMKLHDSLSALTTLARIQGLFAPEKTEEAAGPLHLSITLVPPEGREEAG